MSQKRRNARMVTLDASGWEEPPPGVRWRTAHVLLTKESDGISAVVLNLPGCGSQGDTIEEAMANVREALAGCLAVYADAGQPAPWRNSRNDVIPPFSEERYVKVEERRFPT